MSQLSIDTYLKLKKKKQNVLFEKYQNEKYEKQRKQSSSNSHRSTEQISEEDEEDEDYVNFFSRVNTIPKHWNDKSLPGVHVPPSDTETLASHGLCSENEVIMGQTPYLKVTEIISYQLQAKKVFRDKLQQSPPRMGVLVQNFATLAPIL